MSDPDVRVSGRSAGMAEVTSLAASFAIFEQAVLAGWEPRWRREAYRCFMAGAQAVMAIHTQANDLPDAAAEALVLAIIAEMDRYIVGVLREAGDHAHADKFEADTRAADEAALLAARAAAAAKREREP